MQYRKGSFGRVFILKFEDRDDLLDARKAVNEETGLVMLDL